MKLAVFAGSCAAGLALFVGVSLFAAQAQQAPPAQGQQAPAAPAAAPAPPPLSQEMSFFITSAGSGRGGDLGGLAGADALCSRLSEAAGVRGKAWRAYLSQAPMNGQPQVNARDRIGAGPWKNYAGAIVADNVAELHAQAARLYEARALNDKGERVALDTHDILTGSSLDGTLAVGTAGANLTCGNWTTGEGGSAQVGHFNRNGGGANPSSWNSAHASRGCSVPQLAASGGGGFLYCFAQ